MSGPRFTHGPDERPRQRIDTHADLANAIVLNEKAGAIGQAHCMRALMRGRIAYLSLLPEASASQVKAFIRATGDRPAVMLIGDDDGMDRGPSGWAQAERALRWTRALMLHGAGAEIEHYEAVIIAAELAGRMLVIECSTATLGAWVGLVKAAPQRPPTLVIRPRGGVHPLPIKRSVMQ
jgi:hypothetical protein